MSYLYGNHILKAHVSKMTEEVPEHQGVVVFNMNDIPLVRSRDFIPTYCRVLLSLPNQPLCASSWIPLRSSDITKPISVSISAMKTLSFRIQIESHNKSSIDLVTALISRRKEPNEPIGLLEIAREVLIKEGYRPRLILSPWSVRRARQIKRQNRGYIRGREPSELVRTIVHPLL